MGLDISFYKKTEVGYFRKVNFILTYFNVTDDDDCVDIEITREKFCEFVADLKCELLQYDTRKQQNADCDEMPPVNPKFNTCEVFFGGSTSYDSFYWADMQHVHDWAMNFLRDFDWDNERLFLNCWW